MIIFFVIIQRPRLPPREWSVCRCPPPGSTSSGGRPRTPTGTARLEATGTARADGTEKKIRGDRYSKDVKASHHNNPIVTSTLT